MPVIYSDKPELLVLGEKAAIVSERQLYCLLINVLSTIAIETQRFIAGNSTSSTYSRTNEQRVNVQLLPADLTSAYLSFGQIQ
jgi:hypothetical protein